MGMYTHLCLNARLRVDTPQPVIDMLVSMVEGTLADDADNDMAHSLFVTERWRWMLRSGGNGFPASTNSRLYMEPYSPAPRLTVNCAIKNYSHEWQEFIDWIRPYCTEATGYMQYEEWSHVVGFCIQNGEFTQGSPELRP